MVLEASDLAENPPAPAPDEAALAELEATCGRMAAEKMTGAERRALEAVHHDVGDLVRRGDPDEYHLANIRFHDLIYQGSHNSFLAETTVALRKRLSPFSRAQLIQSHVIRKYAEYPIRSIVSSSKLSRSHTCGAGSAP